MNKILKKYIKLPPVLMAAILVCTACSNDIRPDAEEGETTDVTLYFGTRAGEEEGEPTEGEGIKTLRVIAATADDSKIVVNEQLTYPEDPDPQKKVGFTIYGCLKLNTGYKVLVIANEASLSDKAQAYLRESTSMTEIGPVTTDSNIFPCQGAPESGLPMCGSCDLIVTEKMQSFDIPIKYIVSKVELTINSERANPFNLGSVSFRPWTSRTALFSGNVSGATGDEAKEIEVEGPVSIVKGTPTVLTYYFYPTSQESTQVKPLEIALTGQSATDACDFAQVRGEDGQPLNIYRPGDMVKINGTITSAGQLTLTCHVNDWTETGNGNDSYLDYSNIVSYTGMGWEGISEQSNTIDVEDGKEYTLKFKIMSPIGATWKARVDYETGGDSENTRFSLDKDSGEAGPEEQQIVVTCPGQIEGEAKSVVGKLVIEVQNLMNRRWEVPMYPAGDATTENGNERAHYILSLKY